jgi:hypothetical protein
LVDLKIPETVPVSVPSDLLHQRPDILAAETAVKAAADAAGAATASMFPSLSLTASYGHGAFDWSTFTSPQGVIWNAGASLTQPLFHGGALMARRKQYQATYEAAVADYKQTVLSAFRNVADTLASLSEDANTVTQTRRAQVAAQDMRSDTDSGSSIRTRTSSMSEPGPPAWWTLRPCSIPWVTLPSNRNQLPFPCYVRNPSREGDVAMARLDG